MADLLEELAAYIAANSTFVVGTDLFVNWIPPVQPDTALCLLDAPGRPQGPSWQGSIGQYGVQVLSRAGERHIAKSKALDLEAIVKPLAVVSLGTWTLHSVEPTTPYPLGLDERGRPEFAARYILRASSG